VTGKRGAALEVVWARLPRRGWSARRSAWACLRCRSEVGAQEPHRPAASAALIRAGLRVAPAGAGAAARSSGPARLAGCPAWRPVRRWASGGPTRRGGGSGAMLPSIRATARPRTSRAQTS